MLESRRELVDRLLTFHGELNDPNARTVAEGLLNLAIMQIWLKHPWRSFMMPAPYALATVAGTRQYVLPSYFGRIASRDGRVRNLTTGAMLVPREGDDFYLDHPEAGSTVDTATGEPSEYVIAGTAGVSRQLVAAGDTLEVISDNAADTDVQVVIEGLDANGVYAASAFTLNGTVAVAAGTWLSVQQFSKSWPQTVAAPTSAQTLTGAAAYTSSRGNVSLRSNNHVTVYQKLLPYESLREHYTLTLWRTPQAVQTIAFPIIRLPRRLVNDADPVPAMWGPAVFEELRKQWFINTGELPAAQAASMPNQPLIDLVCWDNELRAGGRPHTQPFGGM